MSLADQMLKGYERDITVRFMGVEIPAWKFMEHWLRITDKNSQVIPFVLNRPQCRLYKSMCEQRRSGRPIRENVLKARQMGFTTFISGLLFSLTIFEQNVRTAVMADITDHAHNIFAKYQFFYNHLDDANPNLEKIKEWENSHKGEHCPLSYKPELKANRGSEYMLTKVGNSSIEVVVAGVSAGRSGTYQYLHLSEVAFFSNLMETLTGVRATVPTTNPKSIVVFETTANGFNEYKDRWDKDESRRTNYEAFFTAWFENPEYKQSLLEGQDMPLMEEWEYEKQHIHGLTDEQMLWFHSQYLETGDKQATLQEYPFTPTDSFMSTGSCLFGSDEVAQRKAVVSARPNLGILRQGIFGYSHRFSEKGDSISMGNIGWKERRNGAIRIYEEPIEGHPYVIVCDPKEDGGDNVGVQVVDNHNLRQVAVMKTAEMHLDEVAYQMYCLGLHYNTALMSNEMNRGGTVMDYLLKLHYPRLYVDQSLSIADFRQSVSSRFGHKITQANRPYAIEMFVISFRQDPTIINDYETLCEMETFQKQRHESRSGAVTYKDEASSGKHDDLIMAYCGVFLVRGQQSAVLGEAVSNLKAQLTLAQLERIQEQKRRMSYVSPNQGYDENSGIDFGEEYYGF